MLDWTLNLEPDTDHIEYTLVCSYSKITVRLSVEIQSSTSDIDFRKPLCELTEYSSQKCNYLLYIDQKFCSVKLSGILYYT